MTSATKVYRSKELNDALARMRKEMGSEAVILYQRQVRRPQWWPFARPQWELVAAVDGVDEINPLADTAGRPSPNTRTGHADAWGTLSTEIAELKTDLARLVTVANLTRLPQVTQALANCYDRLCRSGIAPELALDVVLGARDELSAVAQSQPAPVLAAVRRHLEERMHIRTPRPIPGTGPLVVFAVGQTGVGKTTTLMKLAAQQAASGRRVAIINADTVRPGAEAQLATLTRTTEVTVDTVIDTRDFATALGEYGDRAAIFVDTPGCSFRDTQVHSKIAELVRTASRRQVFLVLACNTPLSEMEASTQGFASLDLNGIVLTKLDEAQSLGAAVTLACRGSGAMAYYSTGRRIPDDLEVATAQRLVSAILGAPAPGSHPPDDEPVVTTAASPEPTPVSPAVIATAEPAVAPSAPLQPKRRGRPPKTADDADERATPAAESNSAPAAVPAVAPGARRRGRPRKTAA